MLKSTRGPLSALTGVGDMAFDLPPPDGAVLQAVYDAELRYLASMREEGAPALWFGWVPHLSLSVSRREAASLGDLSDFTNEPVAIRPTGGTAVPQGPGTLNVSILMCVAGPPAIRQTYERLCSALADGFSAIDIPTTVGARAGSFCDGDYNLLHRGRKLVGTAQRWAGAGRSDDGRPQSLCLMHCAILTGGDPDWLCGRTEALYSACGQARRYDRDAHSGVVIDHHALLDALDEPLSRLMQDG